MDEKANGGNWRPEWISAVWIRTVPFFREFSPFVLEKIPLDSSKTRCFFFLPAADWLTPQRTELREKCHVPTSDVDLLTGFDPVTTGFSPLPRAAATSRDTLLVADARVDRQIVMAAIARHIVAPRAAAPAPTGAARRAGKTVRMPSARAPASVSLGPRRGAKVATSAVRASSDDARRSRSATSFPASIARRVPTRLVFPIPRSLGSDAGVPLAPHACPPVAIAVDLTRPSPRAIPFAGCRARPARRA